MIIESAQNKFVKQAAMLKTKKERDKTGLFVLEGLRLVNEIPDDWKVHYILIAESFKKEIHINDTKEYIISDNVFNKISDTVNPQGVLAVCEQKKYDMKELLSKDEALFVVLDEIADPGNLGTIIRTADAANVDGIFLSNGCVDLFNPKVIRSTMGSVFHLPVFYNLDLITLFQEFKNSNIKTFAAHLKANNSLYDLNFKQSAAVLVGNEANGISDSLLDSVDCMFKIPMSPKAESMNASVALSIAIYEAVRQRIC